MPPQTIDCRTVLARPFPRRPGKLSRRKRQVDVLASGTVAGAQIEIAIECKRNITKKIGIGTVDALIGKLTDLGITHGIIYAFGGADSGALALAQGTTVPKVEIRDTAHVALLATWEDVAPRFFSAVDCSNPNCWGEISWTDYADAGGQQLTPGGVCDFCGTWAAECRACGEISALDGADVECYGCGATFTVGWTTDSGGLESIGSTPGEG